MPAGQAVVVIARWHVPTGALDEVVGLVAELRRRSLEEPGCIGYEVYQRVDAPGLVVLVERYADAAALEAHRDTRHYREILLARIVPKLIGRSVEHHRSLDPTSSA